MSKISDELYCEYCKNGISLDDKKCPNCGADCTKVINKYKKAKEEEEKEYKDRVLDMTENAAKTVGTVFKIGSISSIIIFIVVFGFIIFGFVKVFSLANETSKNNSSLFDEEKDEKVVNVGFNELAESKKFDVILDKYELFEYTSDTFPEQYKTPEGYQKIAFHFDLKNNLDEILTMAFDAKIVLTADDYNVEKCDTEACMFCYPISGQKEYKELENSFVPENSKTEGYIGFLVPTKYKTLKFKIGSSVVITMDNPAYQ